MVTYLIPNPSTSVDGFSDRWAQTDCCAKLRVVKWWREYISTVQESGFIWKSLKVKEKREAGEERKEVSPLFCCF